MKKLVLTIGLFCISLSQMAHDLHLAVLSIVDTNADIICTLRGDRLDLLKDLDYELTDQAIQDYTNNHIKISFDDQSVQVRYLSHELSEDILTIQYVVETTNRYPKSVRVMTDVLLDEVTGQSNRVFLKLNQRKRSFMISEDNRDIIAFY